MKLYVSDTVYKNKTFKFIMEKRKSKIIFLDEKDVKQTLETIDFNSDNTAVVKLITSSNFVTFNNNDKSIKYSPSLYDELGTIIADDFDEVLITYLPSPAGVTENEKFIQDVLNALRWTDEDIIKL